MPECTSCGRDLHPSSFNPGEAGKRSTCHAFERLWYERRRLPSMNRACRWRPGPRAVLRPGLPIEQDRPSGGQPSRLRGPGGDGGRCLAVVSPTGGADPGRGRGRGLSWCRPSARFATTGSAVK